MNRAFRMRRVGAPLLASLLLAACGLVPTPGVDVKDARLSLPDSGALAGKVVYLFTDALDGNSVPSALQQITVRGNATYRSAAGTLTNLDLFVRPSLAALPASCTEYPESPATPHMVVCDAAGEAAQAIGRLNVSRGQPVAFSLGGAALDTAARGGHGYFGLAFTGGRSLLGDTLELTDLRAAARL